MTLNQIFTSLVLSIGLLSCSTAYKDLEKNFNNKYFDTESYFNKNLLLEYKKKADFEAKKMHDWDSTNLYAVKALNASSGETILPQKISHWKLHKEYVEELELAYDNLIQVYNEALNQSPKNLAVAIVSLDCWAEQQEENWQINDIQNCKNEYLKSMHSIYSIIGEKENNNVKRNLNQSDKSVNFFINKDDEVKLIIYFDFNKYDLQYINEQEIKYFLKNNNRKLNEYLIIGHADTKGTKEYNKILSHNRALAVKKFLVFMGIKKDGIKILAKGESELAIKTDDEIAHPANRRAIIYKIN